MAVFVLVHGGGQGGWVWRQVSRLLVARGHEVYAPTLTGFAERRHLDGPHVTFQTFVDDVANQIVFENLRDVVLVGHSMGGVIIPRVAEAVPDRIRRVVWATAVVTKDGQSLLQAVPQSPWIARAVRLGPEGIAQTDEELLLDANIHDGTPEQRDFIRTHHRPYPQHALLEPGRLSAFLALGLPTGYILATQDRAIEPHVARGFLELLPGCRRAEIDAGHQCMNTRPAELSGLLELMAA
ncbi:MAG TPA: alpha/beta fold hydrolase [Alphaproteobacteria bacterium]|nr:alpha/beta fold hydrolase [Alphaproteobacteria bacterium]